MTITEKPIDFLMKSIQPSFLQSQPDKLLYKKLLILLLFAFCPLVNVLSQNYFQQRVNYEIRVTLNDRRHELAGFESIVYINRSPDTLKFLYFHLWPNAYSGNKTKLANELMQRDGRSKLFKDPRLRGYIDSLNFEIDGKTIKMVSQEDSPDICQLILNNNLNPGDSVKITTPFHVKIPAGGISRLGHVGESYQISQWYPKPAVYDRSGWHQMPYLDQGEFYSEYGRFDVSITLPSNYVVGATGQLMNKSELDWLDKKAADTAWIRFPDYLYDPFPESSRVMKTLRYTQDNVHDFAWFADKRFHVLKGHTKLPESGKMITTWAMFSTKFDYTWSKSIKFINSAITLFSRWNGDYPYDSFTAVQSTLNSGDGMEYPGITVLNPVSDPYLLDEVLAHEICHSWFYSAIGSDERTYPFMDESITTSNETRYMQIRYPSKKLWELNLKSKKLAVFFHSDQLPVQLIDELEWLIPARLNLEQKINLKATDYTYDNYGSIIYSKAPLGFNYLRSYLGDSLYDKIMHDYYSVWKNKHPLPADLREIFESRSNKDLSWFFDDFLGTTKRLDYKISGFKDGKLLVKNRGELNAPLLIAGIKKDTIGMQKWDDGFKGKKMIDIKPGNYSEILIDPQRKMPELFRLNNNIRPTGIFRKYDPVHFQLLYTIEDPAKRYLLFFPAFNWTNSDGFMAGLAFQNGGNIPKPLEYFFIPLYAFRTQHFTGYGKISVNAIPYDNFIRLASFSMEGEQFGAPGTQDYNTLKTGINLFLRTEPFAFTQKVTGYYILASDLKQIESLVPARMLSFVQLRYSLESSRVINPLRLSLTFESERSYQKASAEVTYKYSYYGKKNGLEARFFTGLMLKNTPDYQYYKFAASGRNGAEQYLYEGVFPDRFSQYGISWLSRQMVFSEGGLVSAVNDSLGYSRWLCSLSLATSLPGQLSIVPVKPFANFLLNDHGTGNSNNPSVFIEAGLKAGFWDFLEVYFPLVVTRNIESVTGSFRERIRFIFRLDKFNPFRSKSHIPA